MPRSRSHALLIGIDRYSRRGEPGADLYADLAGAVLDVERWRALLRSRGVPAENLCRLTAPLEAARASTLPTYDRIVEALEELEHRTRPGDEVLFAFSGHGGCVPTLLPELKGDDGVDEALIPAEHHRAGAQVLRDVDLAVILRRWTDHDLRVTLCFDCCHAGGTTRRAGVRGTGLLDTTPRPHTSRIAGAEEMQEVWRSETRRRRGLHPASGWLPDPRGYVLFAASQAHERAHEGRFDRLGPGGAMTHALLQALDAAGPEVTCAELHHRVLERVQQWTEGQTPQLEGERERPFWNMGAQAPTLATSTESRMAEILERGDPGHYLKGQLGLSAHGAPPGFDPLARNQAALRQFVATREPVPMPIRDGEWICLKLENRSLQALFVALYARLPDGGRKRIYPLAGVGEAELLRSEAWDLLPLRPRLPRGTREAIETVEAIAANDSRLFRGDASESVFWTVTALDLPVVAV